MSSYWADACKLASDKPLQSQLSAVYASAGVTVRWPVTAPLDVGLHSFVPNMFPAQIAAYCVCAVASGAMFYLWRRLQEEDRQTVWLRYGWFSALMFSGSCFGAVTWGLWVQAEVDYHTSVSRDYDSSIASQRSSNHLSSRNQRYTSAYIVTHAIEFFCLSVAQLLVLDRMADFAFPTAQGLKKSLIASKKIAMAVVVGCDMVGLCANAVASVYFVKASEQYALASVVDRSSEMQTHVSLGRTSNQIAHSISSYQSFSEVIVVLVIVLAFAVVGTACSRRVVAAFRMKDAAQAENADVLRLHLQIVCTSTFVFLAFLVRSVFSVLYAVVFKLQDSANPCAAIASASLYCDPSCYSTFTHIWQWFQNTPELDMVVMLISSPLALLVSLWGMTSSRTLRLISAFGRSKPDDTLVSLAPTKPREITA
jgi:hypothetical protein